MQKLDPLLFLYFTMNLQFLCEFDNEACHSKNQKNKLSSKWNIKHVISTKPHLGTIISEKKSLLIKLVHLNIGLLLYYI